MKWFIVIDEKEHGILGCKTCGKGFDDGDEVYLCEYCNDMAHRECVCNPFGYLDMEKFICSHRDDHEYYCGKVKVE